MERRKRVMFNNKKITVNFEYKTIVRVVVISILSVLALTALTKVGHILTLIFISFFLAIALNPVVSWIASHLKSKSRVRATGAAYVMVLAATAAFLAVVVPTIITQTSAFIKDLPNTYALYIREDSAVIKFVRENKLEDDISEATKSFRDRYENIGDSVLSTATAVWSFVLSLIVVLAMTFFMLVEGPDWMKYFWMLHDPGEVAKRKKTVTKMYMVVTGYVNGQLLVALISGLAALFALLAANAIFGGEINAVVYALIVSIAGLIPMFGATIGAAIVVVLCAFTSLPLAIAMTVFFLVYQQIENVTIQPLIQSWQSQLTPLIVFISALIGLGFAGVIGAFVAIPIAGVLKVIIVEHYGYNFEKLHKDKDEHEHPKASTT